MEDFRKVTECEKCGSTDAGRSYHCDADGFEYFLMHCKTCSYKWQQRVRDLVKEKEQQKTYDAAKRLTSEKQ